MEGVVVSRDGIMTHIFFEQLVCILFVVIVWLINDLLRATYFNYIRERYLMPLL